MMAVQKIPSNVQCLMNASARVSNFKSAIEELVYNSLDVDSSSVAIRVHIQRNWIQVVDNGNGITNEDFKLLGERYATSKLMDIDNLKAAPNKFGYQGQALANIIEVSKSVKITSRCPNSNETWLKIFYDGKKSECRKVAIRPSKGTTVEINGFLFNLNIQRKCIKPFTELQDIKMFLEHLLLVFNNVSISLRDDSNNEIIFKIHKNRDIYQTFKSLFEIDFEDMQELQVQKNEYKIKAFIGRKENQLKKYQWIYINNKFISHSNLHELINRKVSKIKGLARVTITKTKMKGDYNEENKVERQSVPFYFLFLTCPYFEYDIVYSGKQTSIEFKDWTEINKLIEKLIQFYNGDINSKNTNNQNQKQVKSIEDTRNEVKNIIEKFLGNHNNKKLRVSQMQNGVKGKEIKRKNKKVLPPLSFATLKTNAPCRFINNNVNNKIKSPKNKCLQRTQLKSSVSKHCFKPAKKSTKFKCNQKSDNAKRSLKYKYNKVDNLIEIFKKNSDTIKGRCKEISSHLNNLMNLKCCKIKESTTNKDINLLSARKETNNGNPTTTKVCEKIMKPKPQSKLFNNNNIPVVENTKSYDLLKTILKTPQRYNQITKKEDTRIEAILVLKNDNMAPGKISILNSDGNRSLSDLYQTSQFSSKLTYESHKYNKKNHILPEDKKYLLQDRDESRDNFICSANKRLSDFQLKAGKVVKPKNQYKTRNLRKRDSSCYYKLLNKYKQDILDAHFSIDTYQESDIIEFSKKIRNQIINDMKLLSNNNDQNNTRLQNKRIEHSNHKINFKIESTYTILIDSVHNSSQIFSSHINQNTLIKDTVTTRKNKIISCNDKTCSSNDDVQTSLKKNDLTYNKLNVIIPESPNTSEIDEPIEPLDICEVVFTNSDALAEEFNGTFGVNKNNNSLFVVKCDEKNYIDIRRLRNCDSLNDNYNDNLKTDTSTTKYLNQEGALAAQEINRTERDMDHMKFLDKELYNHAKDEDQLIENEAYTLQDNFINNFKLLSRHRFMPKGTSPIFKNVFSKNICSYNLDKEYYEDTIYNNFVKDVEINTEIFEPRVQSVKDLTTGRIGKLTDELKNNSANLIFEAESLANGKVLGQVDCKFIAAKILAKSQACESSEFLVLFDQHAVHERIKLENNLEYYFNDNNWRSVTIEAISMKVTKDEILYLHNHKDKFTRCGLTWTVINNCEILVNTVPEAIVGKNPRPTEIILRAVRNLVTEQINGIKYLKGNVSLYPRSIMDLVFSEACRYAIKFGDMLSNERCQQLILELSKCKTPFQCAHGRPVMAVMMELKRDSNKYEIDTQKLKLFKNQIK